MTKKAANKLLPFLHRNTQLSDTRCNKPSPSFELVLGLTLSYKISNHVQVQFSSAVGAKYLTYRKEPDVYWSITTRRGIQNHKILRPGWPSKYPFWNFLNDTEIVGFNPIGWSISVKYTIISN